jgi:ATP-dependent DNA ligase
MELLTYPARPVNGGRLEHAPRKVGRWSFEPKYNGWRAIVHVPTGTMWNRHGQRLTIAREFDIALAALKKTQFEWLDVEALERRPNLGRGSLIILDCPEQRSYEQRRLLLRELLVVPHVAEYLIPTLMPEANAVYLAPRYSDSWRELWQQLQDVNKAVKCPFYEGVVAKRNDSIYPLQLNNPDQETGTWMKHRFIL